MKFMKIQKNREGHGETVQDIKVEIEFLQKTQTEIKLEMKKVRELKKRLSMYKTWKTET